MKKCCCFPKAPPGRPLSSAWYEAIWCWVRPVLFLQLQMPPSAAGEAQLTGSTPTGSLGAVLELGQGAFLGLLILCQHNTPKDSGSRAGRAEAASASDPPFGLKGFSGASLSCPEQTAAISCHPSQGPPAALLRVVVLKLLTSGIHHRAPQPAEGCACLCLPTIWHWWDRWEQASCCQPNPFPEETRAPYTSLHSTSPLCSHRQSGGGTFEMTVSAPSSSRAGLCLLLIAADWVAMILQQNGCQAIQIICSSALRDSW